METLHKDTMSLQQVRKRNGRLTDMRFDKITSRIVKLSYGLDMKFVDPVLIAQKVIGRIYPGIKTTELDVLAAETAASMTIKHSDYAILAARIAVSNLHKETEKSFSKTIARMHAYVNPRTGTAASMVSDDFAYLVAQHADVLDAAINHDQDYNFNYFGFKTLERTYLRRIDGNVCERPQHMFMRVAVGIHMTSFDEVVTNATRQRADTEIPENDGTLQQLKAQGVNIVCGVKADTSQFVRRYELDVDACLESYRLMSEGWFTHATPTLTNAGAPRNQLSSCFLLTMSDDSIEGIYDTLKQCALISKSAGGIGLAVHNIRASGSYIAGTNGNSNGLVPMLRVFSNTARYVDQGGNKRPGAFAVYLEPYHADIFEFLELKKNTGAEEMRARDLFFALWVPDLFMQRVKDNGKWTLMCPHECPGLSDCYDSPDNKAFTELYEKYEREGKGRKTIDAQKLWYAILEAQTESGTPYMLFKDKCNQKSNQKNLGTIKCSNLCTEIIQYCSPDEVSVCNLASLALPKFVNPKTRKFDFQRLHDVTKVAVRNLNKVIDINYYPLKEARRSNLRHRPIGLGVQGLADAFILMRLPFVSDAAMQLNRQIFETIYHAALEASVELAKRFGPYDSYSGSPISEGILQFDMWPETKDKVDDSLWNWTALRADIRQHGVRNSLMVAPMPTASTSQILGNNEACEPFTSNIYTRKVLSGEFQVVNKHLQRDLIQLGLWNDDMRMRIIADRGSIASIPEISDELKEIYKTVWEIPQKKLVDMAADRGAFIDQSQSFNVFIAEPTFAKLTSLHFYTWSKGLKTGMYYLRTRPASDPIQFTVDKAVTEKAKRDAENMQSMQCSLQNREACTACSS